MYANKSEQLVAVDGSVAYFTLTVYI